MKDPVCGMNVTEASPHQLVRGTQHFYFCGARCRERFAADPPKYLAAPEQATPRESAPPAPKGTVYVCPMHPAVHQDRPGQCPRCGMALELALPDLTEHQNPELVDFTRRFWRTLPLTGVVFALAMWGGPAHGVLMAYQSWLELLLASPVVLWAGGPLFQRGWLSLRHRSPNMWTLISLGAGAAFLYSVVATVLPGAFPAAVQSMGRTAVYFEAAAVIISLALLGQMLELRARSRTASAIRALLKLAPKTARRIRADGVEEDVALEAVKAGDVLRVRPGDKVPVDGLTLSGASTVEESLISGESLPAAKGPGDPLIGGTLNGAGTLTLRAERVGAETLLAQIVQLVAQAQRSRAPLQRLADVVAGYFAEAVVVIALVTFAAWLYWGPQPSWLYGLLSAVSVLIIACPCALGLATPMSIMVASGRGAMQGVLFKDAVAIERLGSVDTLVLDKTGTLTQGRPEVTQVIAAAGFAQGEVLQLSASLEQGSEHPLGSALVRAAREKALELDVPQQFLSTAGSGVAGRVNGRALRLGSAALLGEVGISVQALQADAQRLQQRGASVVYLAVDGHLAGLLAVADPIKATTAAALTTLRNAGLRIVMATGDSLATACFVAQALAIETVHAQVKPAGKLELVAALQAAGHVVAMAGDGVNDAPALAKADVGIAMGTGTDVALHSAAITLVKGDLNGIVRALELSKATVRNMHQNLAFALLYNALGIPLAAGALYPLTGMLLSPMIAALAMTFSSVSVVGNALRLRLKH